MHQQCHQEVINQIQHAMDIENIDVIIRARLCSIGDSDSDPLDFPALAARYPEDKDIYDAAYDKENEFFDDLDILIF